MFDSPKYESPLQLAYAGLNEQRETIRKQLQDLKGKVSRSEYISLQKQEALLTQRIEQLAVGLQRVQLSVPLPVSVYPDQAPSSFPLVGLDALKAMKRRVRIDVVKRKGAWVPRVEVQIEWENEFRRSDEKKCSNTLADVVRNTYPHDASEHPGITLGGGLVDTHVNVFRDVAKGRDSRHYDFYVSTMKRMDEMVAQGVITTSVVWFRKLDHMRLVIHVGEDRFFNINRWDDFIKPQIQKWLDNL